ncbi:MAG: NAD(P)H-hydrate dehydratase [Planctomycetaceae bacterium]|nr:NAD(P)H-hydrate dehydratase [Planctomycetaceae bacterium]
MTDLQHVTQLPLIPPRPEDGHKGSFGKVMIVAGSRGMSGAAALAGLGALRGGAGLVYLAVPRFIVNAVAAIEPSYLIIPLLNDIYGRLRVRARRKLYRKLEGMDAVAIGPGLRQSLRTQRLIRKVIPRVQVPLVIDADGLNALVDHLDLLAGAPAPRLLTPHPGEFARLIGQDIGTVQANRKQLATEFARTHDVVLVLKGQGTVVTDGHRVYINTTGNSGMATGGTGDVLTGLLTAILGQGFSPFEAAQLATFLHGLAGDIAAEELSPPGMIASDLPRFLPQAWKEYLKTDHPDSRNQQPSEV